jgi:hypothetical protein
MKILTNPEDSVSWHRALLLLENVGPKAADDINRLDTFCIALTESGELDQLDVANIAYRDRTQAYDDPSLPGWQYPIVTDPVAPGSLFSARAVILYDRDTWNQITDSDARREFLKREGRVLYLTRFGASILEGRRP